jgi:hypothetical protein
VSSVHQLTLYSEKQILFPVDKLWRQSSEAMAAWLPSLLPPRGRSLKGLKFGQANCQIPLVLSIQFRPQSVLCLFPQLSDKLREHPLAWMFSGPGCTNREASGVSENIPHGSRSGYQCSTTWTTSAALFVLGIFKIASQELFAQGWIWIAVLLISASWVARVTGVNHQHLAYFKVHRNYYYFSLFFDLFYGYWMV